MRIQSKNPFIQKDYKNSAQRALKEVQRSPDPAKDIIATGVGIDIRRPMTPNDNAIKNNRPEDPLVSKKILDSLDLGLINFSQKERDTIAKIMMNRSRDVIKSRNS